MQLSKELNITQSVAWFMLQRLREAYSMDDGNMLVGIVEVDGTYIDGKEANKHNSKKLKAGRGGNVKTKPVCATDAQTLQGEIHENVMPNRSYLGLGVAYNYQSVKHSAKEYVNGMGYTNGIESVWAVLKRGYNGVYHNWGKKHAHRYVDEFSFRLNDGNGNCKINTTDRIKALCSAMVVNAYQVRGTGGLDASGSGYSDRIERTLEHKSWIFDPANPNRNVYFESSLPEKLKVGLEVVVPITLCFWITTPLA